MNCKRPPLRTCILVLRAETAQALLADPRERSVLHGDLHHDNALDFGARGWRAIDPKGLIGERPGRRQHLCQSRPERSEASGRDRARPLRIAIASFAGFLRRPDCRRLGFLVTTILWQRSICGLASWRPPNLIGNPPRASYRLSANALVEVYRRKPRPGRS